MHVNPPALGRCPTMNGQRNFNYWARGIIQMASTVMPSLAGYVRAGSVIFRQLSCNAPRMTHTVRDTRLNDANHYYLLFQCAGQMLIDRNGRQTMLNSGEIALIDSSRPVTDASDGPGQRFALHLPRKSLASYLGFEPEGGQCRNGAALPARLLRELVSDAAVEEVKPKSISVYVNLAVFDVVGALFSDPSRVSVSAYTDKLFGRASDIITSGR